jgi:hypothetical protein
MDERERETVISGLSYIGGMLTFYLPLTPATHTVFCVAGYWLVQDGFVLIHQNGFNFLVPVLYCVPVILN